MCCPTSSPGTIQRTVGHSTLPSRWCSRITLALALDVPERALRG